MWKLFIAVVLLIFTIGLLFSFHIHKDIIGVVKPVIPYEQVSSQTIEEYTWIEPQSILIKAGYQDNKNWSTLRMLLAWKKAGFTPDDSYKILKGINQFALPTLVAGNDPKVLLRYRNRVIAFDSMVKLEYPTQFLNLQKISSSEDIGASSVALLLEKDDGFYPWLEVLQFLDMISPPPTDLANPLPRRLQHNWQAAQLELKKAVLETGLKDVQIPLSVWGDSYRLVNIAESLKQANLDLGLATGWNGKVLGLNGRVSLNLSNYGDAYTSGYALNGQSLLIQASWPELSHEWFHALDLTLSRLMLSYSWNESLTGNQKSLFHKWKASPLVNQWWENEKEINLIGATWINRRKNALDKNSQESILSSHNPRYWLNKSEIIAYAWEGYLSSNKQFKFLSSDVAQDLEFDENNLIRPSPEEQERINKIWKIMLSPYASLLGLNNKDK